MTLTLLLPASEATRADRTVAPVLRSPGAASLAASGPSSTGVGDGRAQRRAFTADHPAVVRLTGAPIAPVSSLPSGAIGVDGVPTAVDAGRLRLRPTGVRALPSGFRAPVGKVGRCVRCRRALLGKVFACPGCRRDLGHDLGAAA